MTYVRATRMNGALTFISRFTARGIGALVVSILSALLGIGVIGW